MTLVDQDGALQEILRELLTETRIEASVIVSRYLLLECHLRDLHVCISLLGITVGNQRVAGIEGVSCWYIEGIYREGQFILVCVCLYCKYLTSMCNS